MIVTLRIFVIYFNFFIPLLNSLQLVTLIFISIETCIIVIQDIDSHSFSWNENDDDSVVGFSPSQPLFYLSISENASWIILFKLCRQSSSSLKCFLIVSLILIIFSIVALLSNELLYISYHSPSDLIFAQKYLYCNLQWSHRLAYQIHIFWQDVLGLSVCWNICRLWKYEWFCDISTSRLFFPL